MSNKFLYKTLLSTTGTNPYLYTNDNVIYALVNNHSEKSVWIDLFMSYDNGETWLLDEYLPIDVYKLYDPKIVTIDRKMYVFGHGLNDYSIDTIRYIKYDLYRDDDELYAWDENWQDLFDNYLLHARITDLIVDNNKNYIHITYDKATTNGTYGVYYAILAVNSNNIVFNTAIASHPSANQHNAKIVQLSTNLFGICWEEENEYKKNQVKYLTFDSLSNTFTNIIDVSVSDQASKYIHHYHPAMTKDSFDNIHIAWLTTKDNYDTSEIQYVSIINNVRSDIAVLTDIAENNKYPFLICDENDNLYILYNHSRQNEGQALQTLNYLNLNVRYLVKKFDVNSWQQITDLADNNWNILCGWCNDQNIYSLIIESNSLYFVRIDTNLAEVFSPVQDLQINAMDNASITLSWTKARNAEAIYLERLDEDKYYDAVLVEPLSVTDTWAVAVDLTPGVYKFRIKYTTTEGVDNVVYLPNVFNLTEPEQRISWEGIDNIISQTLQYTKETWSEVDVIPIVNDTFTHAFTRSITRLRLHVVGGVADGYSNEIQPLTITLEGEDIRLNWSKLQDIKALAIQESSDGINWYNANPKEELSVHSVACTITNLNNVSYHYRLIYKNSQDAVLTSNVVNIINNLKVLAVSYNTISIHWNDIMANEGKYFQYSIDHGITWVNALYPISNNTAVIPELLHDTEYLVRLYFPNRYTGKYSNTLTVTTKKKPIEDLTLLSQTNTTAVLTFTIDDTFSDIKLMTYDLDKRLTTYLLSEVEHIREDLIVNDTWTGQRITFQLNALQQGMYYNIAIKPLDSHRGETSNVIRLQTKGMGIEKLVVKAVSAHEVTLYFGVLDKITDDNVSTFMMLYYSVNNIDWMSQPITTTEEVVLKDLMQESHYYAYLECYFGDNYGSSPIIDFITSEESFKPLYTQRIPGERCFCKADECFYIMDKGILYEVTDTTQNIVFDYKIKANHVYSSMEYDASGYLHIVMCYGKGIYYASNCILDDGTKLDIREPFVISYNENVNEMMFPDIKLTYDNKLIITYEENYGYYSNIMYCVYKNAKEVVSPTVLLNDNAINSCQKLALKNSHAENRGKNGYYIIAIDNNNVLKVIENVVDSDKESDTYKREYFNINSFQLNDNLIGIYNNLNIESDNLDQAHFCYYSYNNDTRSVTYAVIEKDNLSQLVFNNCQYGKVIPRDSLIMLIENDRQLYSSKYNAEQSTFTDRLLLNDKILESANTIEVIHDSEDIHTLSFENGKFLIQTFKIKDIEDNNNYINDNWIDNVFSLDDDECSISVWTDGNIHEYPAMYVKINSLVSDITPKNSNGDNIEKTIIINDLVNKEEAKYVYNIKYNDDKVITINANDRLSYDWDNTTIINNH